MNFNNKKIFSAIFTILFITVIHCFAFHSAVLNAQLQPIFEKNKIGYIDSTGKIIIPCEFVTDINFEAFTINDKMIIDFRIPSMARFQNGAVTVKIPKKYLFYTHSFTYAMLDSEGKYIFEPTENMIYGLSEGIAIYKRLFKTIQKVYDFNFTYIDLNQNFITAETFSFAGTFNNGLALVINNSDYKYINRKGKKAFEISVPKIENKNFSSGLATSKIDSFFENIDTLENFNTKIEMADNFSEGLAAIRVNSLWGYIDTVGNWTILPTFISAFPFQNGVARIFDGQYYSYINKNGEKITSSDFAFASDFSDGLGLVKIGEKFGFIDTNGKVVIPLQYIYAQSFSEGLAVVYHNGNFVFIDKKGEVVINRRLDFAKGFQFGLAKAWRNDELFYINKKGETVHQILSRSKYRNQISSFKRN